MPEPIVPDYSGPNLTGVVPGLLLGRPGHRPSWFPEAARNAERTVLLVLDGFGWNQYERFGDHVPTLAAMEGRAITTVIPSTTATALTSLVTGATPIQHGVVGYRMDVGDRVMNTLRWADGRIDLRSTHPPDTIQPVPSFCGRRVPVVSRAEHEGTGFTEAHLRGSIHLGWRSPSSIVAEVVRCLSVGHDFVYAYYDGIDKIAHERGFGPFYESELRMTDDLVARLIDALPVGTTLCIVADHGQVMTGEAIVHLDPEVERFVSHQSGEGRFRWLHARRGRVGELCDAARRYEDIAWVVPRERVLDEGWFGASDGAGESVAGRRFGDVALVPFGPDSFHDPLDSGPFPLVCRHGSLTSDEMLVPFLARTV